MFGREIRLSVDLLFGAPPEAVAPPSYIQYARNLREQVGIIHQYARNHLNIESQRHKRLNDRRAHANSYKEGEKVWLHNPQSKRGRRP